MSNITTKVKICDQDSIRAGLYLSYSVDALIFLIQSTRYIVASSGENALRTKMF